MNFSTESERFFVRQGVRGQNRRRHSRSYVDDRFCARQRSRAENKPLECKVILLGSLNQKL